MSMHVPSTLTISDILKVEDDPALLDFRCSVTGLPLWPQVRVALFRMLMSDVLYGVRLTGASSAAKSWKRAAWTMLRSLSHNAKQFQGNGLRARICITSDGVADQLVDGRWFNRLIDHFIAVRPDDSLAIADQFEWRWPFPRHHDRILLHAPWQAVNAIRGKMCGQAHHHRQADDLVQLVCDRARQHVGWSLDAERRAALTAMLVRKAASMPWQYDAYARLLARIQPVVLLVGGGCYGPATTLIAAAKGLGIHTAEYQHGAISAGHDAYNFAPAIRDSEVYRKTLPDHFLGYGSWWNEQINAPVCKWAIGNPHRTEQLSGLGNAAAPQTDLLVLSDGIEFNLYLDLARSLTSAAAALGLRVVLRPHPLERTRVFELTERQTGGVTIDRNVDLYESFRTAHAVVSEVSTGLFEAVGIVPRIFIWDTAKSRFGYPRHPFRTFGSVDELTELLTRRNEGALRDALTSDCIWAEGWRKRFAEFLTEQGVV